MHHANSLPDDAPHRKAGGRLNRALARILPHLQHAHQSQVAAERSDPHTRLMIHFRVVFEIVSRGSAPNRERFGLHSQNGNIGDVTNIPEFARERLLVDIYF